MANVPLGPKTLFDEPPDDDASAGQPVIRVALDTGADSLFDYAVPPAIGAVEPGRRVLVPFGKSNEPVQGFCVAVLDADQAAKSRGFKLKAVKKLPDSEPLLNEQLLKLAQWISDYYVCPLGQVLAAMVPGAVKKDIGRTTEVLVYLAEQNPEILSALHGAKQKAIVSLLTTSGAMEESLALSQKELLDRAACKDAPLKNLSRRGIVKLVRREVLHSPPIVPKQFWLDEHEVVLNDDQRKALDQIVRGIDAQTFGVTLLYGVTDSGKTEVYIRAIERTIAAGKSAIVLLPEIALTAQTVQRFSRRFSRIAVMHCRLTAAQRNAQWRQIREGLADVVIGARSAVFAPLPKLGLIVVDEEHEPSYKQDTVPRYHGRDVAIKRAHLAGAHCILGSATPSLESLYNSRVQGHYQLARLPHRVTNLPMPEMQLVDMLTQRRGQKSRSSAMSSKSISACP